MFVKHLTRRTQGVVTVYFTLCECNRDENVSTRVVI